jgi:hypothetical protein
MNLHSFYSATRRNIYSLQSQKTKRNIFSLQSKKEWPKWFIKIKHVKSLTLLITKVGD